MQLFCPTCRTLISADDINIDRALRDLSRMQLGDERPIGGFHIDLLYLAGLVSLLRWREWSTLAVRRKCPCVRGVLSCSQKLPNAKGSERGFTSV